MNGETICSPYALERMEQVVLAMLKFLFSEEAPSLSSTSRSKRNLERNKQEKGKENQKEETEDKKQMRHPAEKEQTSSSQNLSYSKSTSKGEHTMEGKEVSPAAHAFVAFSSAFFYSTTSSSSTRKRTKVTKSTISRFLRQWRELFVLFPLLYQHLQSQYSYFSSMKQGGRPLCRAEEGHRHPYRGRSFNAPEESPPRQEMPFSFPLTPPSALTQREVYYAMVRELPSQQASDRCVGRIQHVLGLSRRSLGIVAGQRGSIGGRGIQRVFPSSTVWGRNGMGMVDMPHMGEEMEVRGETEEHEWWKPNAIRLVDPDETLFPIKKSKRRRTEGHAQEDAGRLHDIPIPSDELHVGVLPWGSPCHYPAVHSSVSTNTATAPLLYTPPLFYLSPSTVAIIVVEKYSIYQRLLAEDCPSLFPCIIMTSHGFPTHAARRLLSNISLALRGWDHFFHNSSSSPFDTPSWREEEEGGDTKKRWKWKRRREGAAWDTSRMVYPPPRLYESSSSLEDAAAPLREASMSSEGAAFPIPQPWRTRSGISSTPPPVLLALGDYNPCGVSIIHQYKFGKGHPNDIGKKESTNTTKTTTAASASTHEKSSSTGKPSKSTFKSGTTVRIKDQTREGKDINKGEAPHPFTGISQERKSTTNQEKREQEEKEWKQKMQHQAEEEAARHQSNIPCHVPDLRWLGLRSHHVLLRVRRSTPAESLSYPPLSFSDMEDVNQHLKEEEDAALDTRWGSAIPTTHSLTRSEKEKKKRGRVPPPDGRGKEDAHLWNETPEQECRGAEASSASSRAYQYYSCYPASAFTPRDIAVMDHLIEDVKELQQAYRNMVKEYDTATYASTSFQRSPSTSHCSPRAKHVPYQRSTLPSNSLKWLTTSSPSSPSSCVPSTTPVTVSVHTTARQLVVDLLTRCPACNPITSRSGRYQQYITGSPSLPETRSKTKRHPITMPKEDSTSTRRTHHASSSSAATGMTSSLQFLGSWLEELYIMKEAKMKIELDMLLDAENPFSSFSSPLSSTRGRPSCRFSSRGHAVEVLDTSEGVGQGRSSTAAVSSMLDVSTSMTRKRLVENKEEENNWRGRDYTQHERGGTSSHLSSAIVQRSSFMVECPPSLAPSTRDEKGEAKRRSADHDGFLIPTSSSLPPFFFSDTPTTSSFSMAAAKPLSYWLYQRILEEDYI